MAFIDLIKSKIPQDVWNKLNKLAEDEVSIALNYPLKDRYQPYKDNFPYMQRFLMGELLDECDLFDKLDIKILPTEIIDILFRVKLIFVSKDQQSFYIRSNCRYLWDKKSDGIDKILTDDFESLGQSIRKRTLATPVNSYNDEEKLESLVENVAAEIKAPFEAFINDKLLIEKHKQWCHCTTDCTLEDAKQHFKAPSLTFSIEGTPLFCRMYAGSWNRTLLNLIRVTGFISPCVMSFGDGNVKYMAPLGSSFIDTGEIGCFNWQQDKLEPWRKIPDGCLFLSFGFRGLSEICVDGRTLPEMKKLILENKIIFNYLKRPWGNRAVNDIYPALDILNSATQLPDLGAKILLSYCCLEHLLVPKGQNRDNKKYIVGGINALRPDLLPWFNELYKLRCDYAHKGYVQSEENIIKLIKESMRNILFILSAKLSLDHN